MSRNKIKLPKKYIEEYIKNPNLPLLAARCDISFVTARTRLREMGIIILHKKKKKSCKRVFSKEFLENRKRNTERNDKYFRENNIESKKAHLNPLQAIGYHKS